MHLRHFFKPLPLPLSLLRIFPPKFFKRMFTLSLFQFLPPWKLKSQNFPKIHLHSLSHSHPPQSLNLSSPSPLLAPPSLCCLSLSHLRFFKSSLSDSNSSQCGMKILQSFSWVLLVCWKYSLLRKSTGTLSTLAFSFLLSQFELSVWKSIWEYGLVVLG